jgi:tetratricopeptide (TPR) repeat protein
VSAWIGPYEVLGEVGRGGMGVVLRVRARDGGDRALKLLRPGTPEARARFERERRLLGSLGEVEGFVPLLDFGEAREGPYLVMPFVTGGTLRQRLARGPLPAGEAADLVATLARTVGRAHELGIVHRDLKPENVLFTAAGAPLVADLGLAKHWSPDARGASQSVSLSRAGELRGTAGYMAPEQASAATEILPAADVFALGAILHECLSGEPAFGGESVLELLRRLETCAVSPLPRGTPRWLARVVERALARDPGARFEDGRALSRALALGEPRRARWPLVAVGVLVLATGAATAGALAHRGPRVVTPAPRPREVEALIERGRRALLGDGRFLDDAEVKRLLELAPLNVDAITLGAVNRQVRGDGAGAIHEAARAIELEPGNPVGWARRGWVRGEQRDVDGALADFDKAIALGAADVGTFYARGAILSMRGDRVRAVADFQRAATLAPDYAEPYLGLGAEKLSAGDAAGALADFERAVQLGPRKAAPFANRGAVRLKLGDGAGARADLDRALELEPRNAFALTNRAWARHLAGDDPGALRDLDDAIAFAPNSLQAHANRLQVRRLTGDDRGALEDIEWMVANDPSSVTIGNRGAMKLAMGDFDGARPDLDRALALDGTNESARFCRGQLHLFRKDLDGAIEDFTRSTELLPGDGSRWFFLAKARSEKGEREAALAALDKAFQLGLTGENESDGKALRETLRAGR